MFPLQTKNFPDSAAELEALLNASLEQVLLTQTKPVRVIDRQYPGLQEIAVNLDGAELRSSPPAPPRIQTSISPALQVDRIRLSGQRVLLGPAKINLSLEAREVRIDRGVDADDQVVLKLEAVASGKVEISADKTDLETAIREIAKLEASKHGVTIEDVQLTLRQLGPRALETEINLRARKMFFAASIRIEGKAEMDEQLNASLANLRCTGEGAIGSIACGFLSPQLQKLEGRSFALAAFSFGEVRLRDVSLQIGEQITVTAIC